MRGKFRTVIMAVSGTDTSSSDKVKEKSKPSNISRWSESRYTNSLIPHYIPPETFTYLDGQYMRAFKLCALAHDYQRLIATNDCEQCFVNLPLTPEYNASGVNINDPDSVISESRRKAIQAIMDLHSRYGERIQGKGKEIFRKIRLTKEQIDSGSWGALLGARGHVHQKLEKEYNCRIVLAGKGITDTMKDTNLNASTWAMEEPHVRLTASNETDLQAAAERIEWILSDDPEAVEYREQNRRRTAQVEGRYDPRTWVSSTGTAPGAGKRKREENPLDDIEEGDGLGDFLEEFVKS